jgi:hypothetical protein
MLLVAFLPGRAADTKQLPSVDAEISGQVNGWKGHTEARNPGKKMQVPPLYADGRILALVLKGHFLRIAKPVREKWPRVPDGQYISSRMAITL